MSTQQLEKHDQLRILDEHAEYLTALTAIDVFAGQAAFGGLGRCAVAHPADADGYAR